MITRPIVMTLVVVFLGVAVGSLVLPTRQGSVMSGDTAHDFGRVEIADYGTTVTHTFSLANVSDLAMTIQGTTSSCGCVVALPSSRVVEPDEELEIVASMTLSASGRKFELIHLDFGKDGVITLQLAATGRRTRELRADRRLAYLTPHQPTEVRLVYLDYDSDSPPDVPRVDAFDGMRCIIGEWSQVQPRNTKAQTPARWHAGITMECDVVLTRTHEIACSVGLLETTIEARPGEK